MKRTLLCIALAMFTTYSFSQISNGQTSDFQSGTDGWRHNISNPSEPVQVVNGGPFGSGDSFLRTTNTGVGTQGSRHAMINTDANWIGDYNTAGIVALQFDVQNPGTRDLHLRVAFRSATTPSDWAASSTALVIPSGSAWTQVTLSTEVADLVMSQGGGTVSGVMDDVSQVRIVSNDGSDIALDQLHKGQRIVLESDYDNIVAVNTLSTPEVIQQNNEFTISPNPARTKLNITLPSLNDDMRLEVYDVLGKRVYKGTITNLESSIDVSNWKSGVYLVRVSNDKITQTKRFIKQ